jgi:hypothetical protein
MFTTKLYSRETTMDAVNMEILHYMYCGTVHIDEDNVWMLLQTSGYLPVPGIVQLCCDFIKNKLDPENCIGVMRYAR